MEDKKYLTTQGLSSKNLIFIVLSISMAIVALYLTKHFYQVYFPEKIVSDGLCSSGSFWGCDKTTTSALGSIFNVPTAFFGMIIGLMGLIGAIFPSAAFEKTNKFLFTLNAVGCVVLLLFSLFALGGLCQFCTLYYALSFAAFFCLFKFSPAQVLTPDYKILGTIAIFVLAIGFYLNGYFEGKMKTQDQLNAQYIQQYKDLPTLGAPLNQSGVFMNKPTPKYMDAPLRMLVFSDFQCPYCSVVSNQLHELKEAFKDKLSIQYMFYPLDAACNKNIKGKFHDSACKAAYLAACSTEKFNQVHDYIFENQSQINNENLDKWEKNFGLQNCYTRQDLKDLVVKTVEAGDQYQVKSTPTIIINEKKIEGTIPTIHLKAILKSLL